MGIEIRNSECQLCESDCNPTQHHIIPQCLENGKDSGKINGDTYTRSFVEFYEKALEYVPEEVVMPFRAEIRRGIHGELNLLSLCYGCHSALHLNRLDEDKLEFSPNACSVPERLLSLRQQDAHLYFEYWILDVLVEAMTNAKIDIEP